MAFEDERCLPSVWTPANRETRREDHAISHENFFETFRDHQLLPSAARRLSSMYDVWQKSKASKLIESVLRLKVCSLSIKFTRSWSWTWEPSQFLCHTCNVTQQAD